MRSSLRLAAALSIAALSTGCMTAREGTWIYSEDLPETRGELYSRFGPPAAIRREGEDRWLRYDSAVVKGMTFGLRYLALGAIVGRSHRALSRVWIEVGPNDRILTVAPDASPQPPYRLWPFGD